MSTILTIIKFMPWILTLIGAGGTVFYRFRMKWLDQKFDEHVKTIKNLKEIVINQGEEIEKKSKTIDEMLKIEKKYNKKKDAIKTAKNATKIMEDLGVKL